MIELLAALLLIQDKADADRVKAVDALESRVRAHGLPSKMGPGTNVRVPKDLLEDKVLRAFAEQKAPGDGAVLAVSSSGLTWTLAGGSLGDDGVPVALFGYRKGITIVIGGARKHSALSAEALWAWTATSELLGGNWGAVGVGPDAVHRVMKGAGPNSVATGVPQEESVKEEKLAVRGADTLEKDLDALAGEWSKATPERRRELASKLADAHRPTAGVLAAFTKDQGCLVMIGADGTAARPDGLGVEVSGRLDATVILIPGRAKGDGKPGVAKGTGAFIVEPK